MILAGILFSIAMLLSLGINITYIVTNYQNIYIADAGYLLYIIPSLTILFNTVMIVAAILGFCYYRQTVNFFESKSTITMLTV